MQPIPSPCSAGPSCRRQFARGVRHCNSTDIPVLSSVPLSDEPGGPICFCAQAASDQLAAWLNARCPSDTSPPVPHQCVRAFSGSGTSRPLPLLARRADRWSTRDIHRHRRHARRRQSVRARGGRAGRPTTDRSAAPRPPPRSSTTPGAHRANPTPSRRCSKVYLQRCDPGLQPPPSAALDLSWQRRTTTDNDGQRGPTQDDPARLVLYGKVKGGARQGQFSRSLKVCLRCQLVVGDSAVRVRHGDDGEAVDAREVMRVAGVDGKSWTRASGNHRVGTSGAAGFRPARRSGRCDLTEPSSSRRVEHRRDKFRLCLLQMSLAGSPLLRGPARRAVRPTELGARGHDADTDGSSGSDRVASSSRPNRSTVARCRAGCRVVVLAVPSR